MEPIGDRLIVVSFDEPYLVNVCIVFGVNRNQAFILDTHLGPDSMKTVKEAIQEEAGAETPTVIFNSHADYDHVWGNCAFLESTIIGHDQCRSRMISESKDALMKYAEHKRGDVEIVLPNLTFRNRLSFTRESLTFLHTPGHTRDSSSVLDGITNSLFVGDNVESPVPYVNTPDFEGYLRSLQWYREQNCEYLVSSHDPVMRDYELLEKNMEYLQSLSSWELEIEPMDSDVRHVHMHNLDSLSDSFVDSKVPTAVEKHYREAIHYLESLDTVDSPDLVERLRRVID
ncbi:MBL fold metallo-hydrolase [Candidatus Thorarchaeota archaeon]|nr:MAG: MBL fold metallo-hydrolase [Candidatus Thorarchaeota archaeon]